MKKILTLLAACSFLVGGLAVRADAQKTTFLLDWIIYGKHAPFFAAVDKGFYQKYGLDVEYKRGFGSGRTITDVAAKIAPIGFADAGSLVFARANADVKIKVVAMIHAKTIMVATFLKEKGYKSPKDLAGARIGSPVGNAVRVVFPAFAAATGLDPKSVTWVDIGEPGAVLPSMLAGKTDVSLFFATELPTARPAAEKMGKELAYFNYGDWGVQIYNNGIILRDETIQSDPEFVRKAVAASLEAWAWSLIHVDEAVKNFLKYAPAMSEPIIRGHFEIAIEHLLDDGVRRHGLGYMDHTKMDHTVELLTKLQNLKKRIPTADVYTNRFLPQWPALKAALGDKVM